jgi:hypothetical protein
MNVPAPLFLNRGYIAVLMPFVLLDLVLKGISLWKSARSGQKYWFIALLVVNSLGILPLIYLLAFQRSQGNKKIKR